MGLDMYLNAEKYVSGYFSKNEGYGTLLDASGLNGFVTEDAPSLVVTIPCAYWRKANAIHAWFVANVQGGRDECQTSYVGREYLEELRGTAQEALDAFNRGDKKLATELLPPQSGFFFGSTEIDDFYAQDLKDTVNQLAKILDNPASQTLDFSYRASW